MPFFPSLAPPAHASLTNRLDRLRQDLHFLGGRLREGLARVVGEAVAGATRDAVRLCSAAMILSPRSTLPSIGHPRGAAPEAWPTRHGLMTGSTTRRRIRLTRVEAKRTSTPSLLAPPSECEGPRQVLWRQALATGLQAAAWCLRRRTGCFALLLALGAGLASTLAVYLGGTFALAGAGLVGSVITLLALARPAPSTTPGPLTLLTRRPSLGPPPLPVSRPAPSVRQSGCGAGGGKGRPGSARKRT